ncbi:MAG: gliding motility-associated C-terminal domain-containing protein [Bacteroidetes bacterium]|nr:gliding motility-associated C-terminal domain-containing protein [Bacteroidota bacterium]
MNKTGNDTLNGTQPIFVSGYDGPKLTINAVFSVASPGDTVVLGAGDYPETVAVPFPLTMMVAGRASVRTLSMNQTGINFTLYADTFDITDSLDLTQGYVLLTQPAGFFRLMPGARIYGGAKESYVDGRVWIGKAASGSSLISFPIGKGGDYRPTTLSYAEVLSDTIWHFMELYQGQVPLAYPMPTGIRNINIYHHWLFGRSGPGMSTDYYFFLAYDTFGYDDQVYEPASVEVLIDNGSGWDNLLGAGTNPRQGTGESATPTNRTGYLVLGNLRGGQNPMGSKEPFAKFNVVGQCAGTNLFFEDKTISPNAPVKDWRWDFGVVPLTDDTSRLQIATYNYSAWGSYLVHFWVQNDSGYTDTFSKVVDVHQIKFKSFSAADVCLGNTTVYAGSLDISPPDAVDVFTLYTGDGNSIITLPLEHTYGGANTFNVKVIITSTAGCIDSATTTATVHPIPVPAFALPVSCQGDTAAFLRVANTVPAESSMTYAWKVDGNTVASTDTLLRYKFSTAGAHSVKLIAASKAGCVDSLTQTYNVLAPPAVKFWLDPAVSGNDSVQCLNDNEFTFTRAVSAGGGQTFTTAWSWGDGSFGGNNDSVKTYAALGKYQVVLTATTNNNCRDSFIRTYEVKGTINPGFAKLGYCVPDSIVFYDSGTTTSSAVVSRQWRYQSGKLLSGAALSSIKALYTTAGPHEVTYIVGTSEGCMDSVKRNFTFQVRPVPAIMVVSGSTPFCPGDSFVVNASGGKNIEWLLDSDTNRRRSIYSAGNYKARFYTSPGCYADDSITVMVYPAANADAGKDTSVIRGGFVTLRGKGGNLYAWSQPKILGDTTRQNIRFRPLISNTFVLNVTDANGCTDTDTVTVGVTEPDFVKIPNIITPNADNENDAWDLIQLKNLQQYDVRITDYSGRPVFTSSNYQNDWKAVLDGKDLPDGIYYYELKNRMNNDVFKGYIQVIR